MVPIPQLINGCVLFPHSADWRTPPMHRRIWQTSIAEGIQGAETRAAMRAEARRQLTFLVTAPLRERVRLEARMDAAFSTASNDSPTGFACAPIHGRASTLMEAAAAGAKANILLNVCGGWSWQAGDYAILIASDLIYDVAAVINSGLTADGSWTADSGLPVDQPALSLAAPLNYSWPAGSLVWPLIFGKFSADKETALTAEDGAVQITIAELVSARSGQIGQMPAAVPGVGQQAIGKTNVIG